jgi:hypothetical protein
LLKKILVVLAAAIVLLAIVVATRPTEYRVERSARIAAPAAAVYAQIADFHRWDGWSPWARLDPAMKTDYQGPPSGKGAAYHWSGNDKVGEGRMTITGEKPPEQLVIRLEFLKPWTQTSTTVFALAPEGAGTRVTWAMSGENGFVGKAMSLFMDLDKMVGPDFEKGLAALQALAEAEAARAPAASAR